MNILIYIYNVQIKAGTSIPQISRWNITKSITDYNSMPMVKVEAQEEGFMIKVVSESNCQGLLVFILEAFEELGLDVLQARVSCADTFCLETLGVKGNNLDARHMDAQSVEKVVSQAIRKWKQVKQQL